MSDQCEVKMGLDEAILHAREIAESCGVDGCDCAYQHDKLADWLEELKTYRALSTLDHLRELTQAEQDGRLVVQPCKPKDVLWSYVRTPGEDYIYCCWVIDVVTAKDDMWIKTDRCGVLSWNDIGKTFFLTREEAEAALEAQKGGGK